MVYLLHFVFSEHGSLAELSSKPSARTHEALHPKTRQAYLNMFHLFVAFCILNKVLLCNINKKVILAFLECVVLNHFSTCVVTNYISAIRAYFVIYNLSFVIFDHPKIKYYIKSLKINRPLSVKSHNLIDISWLISISTQCSNFTSAPVYRAIFLSGFFSFLRLSNLEPHSLSAFDPSRLLTGQDVFFSKKTREDTHKVVENYANKRQGNIYHHSET